MRVSRRGVSLAELLVVMTACTVLFSLAGQLLCRVMRVQIESRGHDEVERSALRLSRQFRGDVHRAQSVDLAPEANDVFLRLEFANDQTAEFSAHDRMIERRLFQRDKQIAIDNFEFPDAIDCGVKELNDPARLRLKVTASERTDAAQRETGAAIAAKNPIHLRVEAVLGRDSRLARVPTDEDDSP